MSLPDRNRSVTLVCQTGAGTAFEHDDADPASDVRCIGCDRIYTREALIAENGEVIQVSLDEMKSEIVEDVRKHFRDAFRGSKHFKVR